MGAHRLHKIFGVPFSYDPATDWPSTFVKLKLRLVAVDLGQVTGFGFGSHVGMGLRSNSGLVVSRTPSAATTNIKWLEWNVRVVQVVDSCGLREFILVLEKDLLRWVNFSRTIQKV